MQMAEQVLCIFLFLVLPSFYFSILTMEQVEKRKEKSGKNKYTAFGR